MPTIITRGAASARGFGFANRITVNFTITAGTEINSVDDLKGVGFVYPSTNYFYFGFGSASPAHPTIAGYDIDWIFNEYNPSTLTNPNAFWVQIKGFASDPGQSWFKSVTVNGTTLLTANAYNYNYNYYATNEAMWSWNTGLPTITSGNTYSVKIVK